MKNRISRRRFLKTGGLALAAMAVHPSLVWPSREKTGLNYVSLRPVAEKRNFVSKTVDAVIEKIKSHIKDEKLRWMFENCLPNTLDTTVRYKLKDGKPDTFVITAILTPCGCAILRRKYGPICL